MLHSSSILLITVRSQLWRCDLITSHSQTPTNVPFSCHQLEEKVREQIGDESRDKVTLQAERDMFVGSVHSLFHLVGILRLRHASVISSAILILLRELEAAIDAPLLSMQRTSWTTLEHVSGESGYIAELVQAVQEVMLIVRDHVEQKKYLRNFYDKASRWIFNSVVFDRSSLTVIYDSVIITKFTNALVKSRPVKETGAEQVDFPLN